MYLVPVVGSRPDPDCSLTINVLEFVDMFPAESINVVVTIHVP